MGCDIHIATEIKRNDKWEQVVEIPRSLRDRDYSLFSFLNKTIRNDWEYDGFDEKGYPEDMVSKYLDLNPEPQDEDDNGWKVDYGDLHSHSWLSLQELIDKDKSYFCMEKIRVSSKFLDKLNELGVEIPKEINIIEPDLSNASLTTIIYSVASPTSIVYWKDEDCKEEDLTINKGIKELKEIAAKYDITDYNNIRIIFAFDN